MRAADSTSVPRTLIAALPEDRLRALLAELLLGSLPSGESDARAASAGQAAPWGLATRQTARITQDGEAQRDDQAGYCRAIHPPATSGEARCPTDD